MGLSRGLVVSLKYVGEWFKVIVNFIFACWVLEVVNKVTVSFET